MKKVKTNAPSLEQRCPACEGLFTISAASRRKRVQCPQCREVVTLAANGAAEPDAGAPDWMARCEMLQARIETLEQQVEALMVSPRTRSSLIPDRLHDLSPRARDHLRPGDPPESREAFRTEMPEAEAAPRPAFERNLQPTTPEIGLLVATGDRAGQRVAETLTGILARAGWKVRGVTEFMAGSHGGRGLTLAAAPTLPLPRVTSTLNALREAGFAVTFQLDPDRGTNEAMLIVCAETESDNEADL